MRIPTRRSLDRCSIPLFALALALAAGSAEAQLSTFRAGLFSEGNLFLLGPADDENFAYALAAGDFDGDGADDLATGIPNDANLGGLEFDSGIVVVRYGVRALGLAGGTANTVLSQAFGGSPDPPETYDRFGWALAAGDFDGDGFADLAVGGFQDGPDDGGAVEVYSGSAAGLSLDGVQLFDQDTDGIGGEAEEFDQFGVALTVGDFDGDGYDDLAIGVPGEDSDFDYGHGRVVLLYGSAAGLSTARAQSFEQDTPGMDGANENSDYFGRALAAGDWNGDGFDDLGVGVPGENDFAGGVHVLYGSASGITVEGNDLITQDDTGVPGVEEEDADFGLALAAGDFDGDGYDDLAVGAPFADVGLGGGNVAVDAGEIVTFFGSAWGLEGPDAALETAASAGLGASEAGDFWGAALAAGNFDADRFVDLAVGAPGESLASAASAGEVTILRGGPTGPGTPVGQLWSQGSPGVPGADESGDGFGAALVSGDFDGNGTADLAIGAPGESYAASHDGVEFVLYGFLFADGFESANTSRWSGVAP